MDTGSYKETDIKLTPIDINNTDDQMFLYEIIKFRWKHHNLVNIPHRTSNTQPTFEQHVKFLSTCNYKEIYRICLDAVTIGTVYIDEKNVFSIFILPNLLKKAIKERKFTRNEKKRITTTVVHQLMKLNSNIETFYVGINAKNTASLNAAKELNCCFPVEHILGCSNIFYKKL